MAWQSFPIEEYTANLVSPNTPGYPDVYAFIHLKWGGVQRATLWYYRDGASIPTNTSFVTGGVTNYYARFARPAFEDAVDMLRNEQPVFFQWNDTSKGTFLSTGAEIVGEAEIAATV